MTTIYLSDNDILHKLAVFDLLDDALVALETSTQNVHVLTRARHVLRHIISKRYDQEVWERLDRFLQSVQVIDWEVPADEQLGFEDALRIDQGEAVLFSATAHNDDFFVLTGDKASLRALAVTRSCRAVAQRLAGRVICLELVIKWCIEHFGFDYVKTKVAPLAAYDTALRAVFGSGLTSTAQNVLPGLDSYIADLRALPVNLLVPDRRSSGTAGPG